MGPGLVICRARGLERSDVPSLIPLKGCWEPLNAADTGFGVVFAQWLIPSACLLLLGIVKWPQPLTAYLRPSQRLKGTAFSVQVGVGMELAALIAGRGIGF